MAGFEPATDGLRNRCSAPELHWPAKFLQHRIFRRNPRLASFNWPEEELPSPQASFFPNLPGSTGWNDFLQDVHTRRETDAEARENGRGK